MTAPMFLCFVKVVAIKTAARTTVGFRNDVSESRSEVDSGGGGSIGVSGWDTYVRQE